MNRSLELSLEKLLDEELVGFLRCREDADHLEGLKDLFNLLAQYSVFPAIEKRKKPFRTSSFFFTS